MKFLNCRLTLVSVTGIADVHNKASLIDGIQSFINEVKIIINELWT